MAYYLLSVHSVEGEVAPQMSDEEMRGWWAQISALNDELKAAGVWVFGGRLHEPEATSVVRKSGDKVLTVDGPFAESKEHIGGFYLIEADNLDEALAWASKTSEVVRKPIEVRVFVDGEPA
jgi:hypothetical protein